MPAQAVASDDVQQEVRRWFQQALGVRCCLVRQRPASRRAINPMQSGRGNSQDLLGASNSNNNSNKNVRNDNDHIAQHIYCVHKIGRNFLSEVAVSAGHPLQLWLYCLSRSYGAHLACKQFVPISGALSHKTRKARCVCTAAVRRVVATANPKQQFKRAHDQVALAPS